MPSAKVTEESELSQNTPVPIISSDDGSAILPSLSVFVNAYCSIVLSFEVCGILTVATGVSAKAYLPIKVTDDGISIFSIGEYANAFA